MSAAWLITGGSSGLGLSLGRAVLNKGVSVVLTTRNVSKAREAAPDIEKSGGNWLELDFGDQDAEKTVADTVRRHNVGVLVNNAGYPITGAVEECGLDAIRTQFEANVFGPVRLIQAVIPIFRERRAGTIVNIGSSVSHVGRPGVGLYGSTKAALRTITQGLAAEVASFGIRVLLFEPGRFRTNFGKGETSAASGVALYGEAYKGTPVQQFLDFLANAPLADGNPDAAALRMYEVVTKTGMAAGDHLKDAIIFPLGKDSNGSMATTGKEWVDAAELTAPIATSTGF